MAKPITMAVSTSACGIGSACWRAWPRTQGISTGSLSTLKTRPMLR